MSLFYLVSEPIVAVPLGKLLHFRELLYVIYYIKAFLCIRFNSWIDLWYYFMIDVYYAVTQPL